MDKLIELCKELRVYLEDLPVYKEYMINKQNLENNEELQEKRKQIAKYSANNEAKQKLINDYNSHPIVVNYYSSKEELKETLLTIKDIIG